MRKAGGFDVNPSGLETIEDGEYLFLNEEGESFIRQNYKNGKLHGPSYCYYVSGELWVKENFFEGNLYGTRTYYYKDGSIKRTEIWKDGKYE
jgi:antitoxin component YwqK of YwqJK toxin-antitoxin module